MNWLTKFLTSSIGRKLIMSLTGLFLILFLVIHLAGNLQLLADDNGKSFNVYAYMMTHNPLIKVISYGNYFFIILHAIQGILIALQNRAARGQRYVVNTKENSTWASKNMALLGTLVLGFLLIHMGDFWFKMKFTDQLAMLSYEGIDYQVKDLYKQVVTSFSEWWLVLIYIIGLIVLALHLSHGFQSAFQTLGLNHNKYTPAIKTLGALYSILVPLGFAIIPIIYLGDAMQWWNWFSA